MSCKSLIAVSLALAALATVALSPAPLWAQPPAAGAPADPNAPRRPETLKEIVSEIRWNVEQNGALIIVGPEVPRPVYSSTGRPPALPPASPSGLPMQRVEEYFECKIVGCGSVSALTPVTMTALRYKNLPKPSAYAGVRGPDRLRFLLASLTPGQWQKVGAADGLGMGDLDKDQRELWGGIITPEYKLWRPSEDGKERQVPVTPPMVAGMRLHLTRTISYQFRRGNYMMGTRSHGPSGDKWKLLKTFSRETYERDQRMVLGQEVTINTAARAKPSDLDFDWPGLDAMIRLDDVKTVGELIERVAAAAKIELFCDVRYRTLAVHVRGQQARAGDVLKAVCRGLTGTVRRVGGERVAFVVTDDLVGYGTRRAIIRDWIEQNNALIQARDRKVAAALKKARPTSYLSYEPGDPMTPNDKILSKVASFKPPTLSAEDMAKPDWSLKRYLWIPVADLPPGSQAQVRVQIARMQKEDEDNPNSGQRGILGTDAVVPQFESETYLSFPGIGKVKAEEMGSVSGYFEELASSRANETTFPWEKKPLTGRTARRAVIAWMESKIDAQPIARAAARAGFTELWIDAPVDGNREGYLKLLAHGVKAARAEGLVARVMVRVLRPGANSKDAPLTPERNVQGETWTQAMTRLLTPARVEPGEASAEAEDTAAEGANRILSETLARERRTGDWMSLPTPAQRATVRTWIAEIAALPGVDGLVLRDVQPPGFNERPMFAMSAGVDIGDLGYTPERRLRFLRQTGVDPIDLSGSGTNARFNGMGGMGGGVPDSALELTLFSSERLGSVSQQWDSLCRAEGARAIPDLVADLRGAAGKIPVWLYRSPVDPTGMAVHFLYVESMDKPAALTLPAAAPAPAPGSGVTISYSDPAAEARKRSFLVLATLQCQPFGSVSQTDQFLMEIAGLADPKYDPFKGYDGLVVDLNRRTPDAVRLHLEALPPFAAPRAASRKP